MQSIAIGYCDKLIGAYQQAEGIEDLRSGHDYVDVSGPRMRVRVAPRR